MEKKKIIKYIAILIAIILIFIAGNIIRKTYIIDKYEKKSGEYAKIDNFYRKNKVEDNATAEIWRKGNVSIYKRTSEDGLRMIYRNLDEKVGWIIVDTKNGDEVNKAAVKVEEENLPYLIAGSVSNGGVGLETMWQKIQFAFMSSITTKDYCGIKCYEIKFADDWKHYVNKENYICVCEVNGSIDTGLIEYRLNEVTDEDVKLPDLTGFEISENN